MLEVLEAVELLTYEFSPEVEVLWPISSPIDDVNGLEVNI